MNHKLFRIVVVTSVTILMVSASAVVAQGDTPLAPLGTGFTYQGTLTDNGSPANGAYDFRFILYNADAGGSQVGSTLVKGDVPVSQGLFTLELDFGAGAFNGEARWLEVGVRPGSSTESYNVLSPRQPLTAAPYALFSRQAPWSGLSGVPAGFADGVDNNTTYSAGTGLLLSGSQFSVTGAPWSGLTGVPAGFADGVDNNTTYSAGTGLILNVDQFSVSFGGDGAATTVAHSDHNHLGETWTGTDNPLVITGTFGGPDYAALVLGNTNPSGHGLLVRMAGNDGVSVASATDDGVSVLYAGNDGVYVESATDDGVNVQDATDDGVYVASATDLGVYVLNAGDDGVYVASAVNYAGYFNGPIHTTGCTGCTLLVFGVNAGSRPLEAGDIVAIQGVRPGHVAGAAVLWEVVPAQSGQTAVGVVQGWAELVAAEQPDAQDAGLAEPAAEQGSTAREPGQQLVPRQGPAAAGDYLTIVIYGPFQVKVSKDEGAIAAGSRLVVGADGRARPLQTVTVQGVTLAESAPAIGIALSIPDEKGYVWVLVNPQ